MKNFMAKNMFLFRKFIALSVSLSLVLSLFLIAPIPTQAAGTITKTFTGAINQQMAMDGTTAIKDSIHNLAATLTGTSTFETLMGAQAPVIVAVPPNLLPAATASFEDGLTGNWNRTNCTLTNSADWSAYGTKSLKCSPTGSPEIYYDVTSITTAGQYTLSAVLKSAVTTKKFRFTVYDNVSGVQNSSLTDITGEAQQKEFAFTFGAGSTLRYIYLDRQNLAAGDDFYVDAIKLEVGVVATPFAPCSISWPTASLGLTPGMPLSIVCVVNITGDQWADGQPHLMFITRDSPACNGGFELYKSAYGFVSINTWLNGDDKWKAIGLTADNWAPGQHVVVATIDAENNQRIFLDGVEGTASQGSCGREAMLGTNSYVGIHDDGIFPLDGSMLAAIWGRVLSTGEIAALSAKTSWTGVNGVIDMPTMTVNGLSSGNTVKLYDTGDNLITTATESGGTAHLDFAYNLPNNFQGYIKVFDGVTEKARYDAVDFLDGDVYKYASGPTPGPTPVGPGNNGNNGSVLEELPYTGK